jgi:preprotein translocase subunit SecG
MLILADLIHGLLGITLTLVAIFIVLLVLVQRGRGGGLAGALGGMGGSSAFGAKAGDVFTRITIGAAAIWIVLCIGAAKWGSSGYSSAINIGDRTGISNEETVAPLKDDGKAKSASTAAAPGKVNEPADAGAPPAAPGSAPTAPATAGSNNAAAPVPATPPAGQK